MYIFYSTRMLWGEKLCELNYKKVSIYSKCDWNYNRYKNEWTISKEWDPLTASLALLLTPITLSIDIVTFIPGIIADGVNKLQI